MPKETMRPFAYPQPKDETAEATVDIEPQYRKEDEHEDTTAKTNHGKENLKP